MHHYSYGYEPLAQQQYMNDNPVSQAVIATLMTVYFLVIVAIVILTVIGLWKLFEKAGKDGWKSIIPIYNMIIWCDIVGRPRWWVILLFIPFVNQVVSVILALDLAKSYGKDDTYGILVAVFGFIVLPVMGFSKKIAYTGPSAADQYIPVEVATKKTSTRKK